MPATVAQSLMTRMVAGISAKICYRKGCFLKHIFTEIPNSIWNTFIFMMTQRCSLWQLFSSNYVSQYGDIYVAGMALDARTISCMEIRVFYAGYLEFSPICTSSNNQQSRDFSMGRTVLGIRRGQKIALSSQQAAKAHTTRIYCIIQLMPS
jgi:hypothetical protein